MLKRRVVVVNEKGLVYMAVQAMPELKSNEVRIKVGASLISPGTEMALVSARRAKAEEAPTETVFGYSSAGTIEEINSDNVKGLKVGMRVAAMGTSACHADYINVPVNLITPIPDTVSFEEAAFACLAATSLQAVRRAEVLLGEYGAVLGLGIVGNIASQLCGINGARVIGWECIPARTKIAEQCGIKNIINFKSVDAAVETETFSSPYGLDFAIMAFGGQGTIAYESLLKCMKKSSDTHRMGRIVLVGGCEINLKGGAWAGNVDIRASSRTGPGYKDSDYEHGRDYPAGFVQFTTQRNLREIISLIAEKKLVVQPMITHRMPLEEVNCAADLLIDKADSALGVILTMN